MTKKVIVAGAGASGMIAAIMAARGGAEVTVIEAMERPGRKLLMTGNGRCNLTNTDPDLPLRYYGSGKELAETMVSRFGSADTLRFFEELGLLTIEKNGYVYPYNMQASAVLEALLAELRRLRVKLKLKERIEEIWDDNCWNVKTASWCYTADALVIACGSKCLPATGSNGSGYQLARQLGHTIVPPKPALVPLVCEGNYFASLSGVRSRAKVSLYENGMFLNSETGELQWTKYGVSGIVIFQLSRFVSTGITRKKYMLSIDLTPEFEYDFLRVHLENRADKIPKESVAVLLSGIIHEKLIPVILANVSAGSNVDHVKKLNKCTLCRELSEVQIEAIARQIKELWIPVTGTKSFDACQVCAGGVDCHEVSAETLESRKHKNLYFAGELLDVDGPCGGYNLQWAWASGAIAGTAAAQ